ncbi:M23 family metallopeptidase [Aurantimonas sp. Leaf443]|uniref:M23 family metallopeptidase n=1 Tax=Aurantimonas sp. Leaf443 TaxID=1736378 RepID=UPI0006F8DEC7|nr:M23 family metallopeptidase [Aurantimonas sp. Leaf443]KQT82146.1 peptidase M23 [Aurantimonas sp. Leaf443]
MNRLPSDKPIFGDEPALVADRRRGPDRRQVSARWLLGTLLTGLTSTTLMGIALSAALDGHRGAVRPAAFEREEPRDADFSQKGQRVFATAIPVARAKQILELSTLTREGDREVIRTLPFGYVTMRLAARHQAGSDYPSFDPLKVFADDSDGGTDEVEPARTAQIYGARTESEVRLKVAPFSFEAADYEPEDEESAAAAEKKLRAMASEITETAMPVQMAALAPVDPGRFDLSGVTEAYEPGSAFRVIEENVSLATSDEAEQAARYGEEVLPLREPATMIEALKAGGHDDESALDAAQTMARLLNFDRLKAGDALRLGIETENGRRTIVRLSVYRGDKHLASVAQTEDGPFEPALAPEMGEAVAEAFDENASEAPMRADMPTVYDGIYQAALSYGLNGRLCRQLIRMLATEVDLQSRLSPADRMSVFYTLEKGEEAAGDSSEILYVEVSFGGTVKRFYRFRTDDDQTDYYDEDGRSANQFLLRKPVPNARFTSSFSTGRKHPVLGYVRPHWGVDWAAPRGAPILASGAGIVEKSGWTSGYGRQTVLRHANGYETSYSHQSQIAPGIRAGARVRQGQIIGYVGSTGLSTGNHLHYEVTVNGTKVDPMRIKLPSGRVLAGAQLETFQRERDRIDNLLKDHVEQPLLATSR